MAFDSFRDFVNALDQAGELKRIAQPVGTELEITEIADREMKSPGGGKALLFEKPTVNGVVSPFPVAINTLGSHKRMAMSMGAESVDEVANELGALMKAKPPTSFRETIKLLGQALDLRHAKPKIVKSGACKEVIHLVDSPKLAESARLAESINHRLSTINSAQSSYPQMLAFGRRTFHHAAVRRDARPRHRRAQRRHVSHPDLR
jgi:4-hydroxy-3-polyprenylbenzoate decarboxylase